MEKVIKEGEKYSKELICLLDNLNVDEYSVVSNLIRNYKDSNWSGFKTIGTNTASKKVFSAWVAATNRVFFSDVGGREEKLDILKNIKDDLRWWAKNKCLSRSKGALKNRELNPSQYPKVLEENEDLYLLWNAVWIDAGLVRHKSILNSTLVNAILVDNVTMVKKLVEDHRLDINQDVIPNVNFQHVSGYDDVLLCDKEYPLKLGSFVRSARMVKQLASLGFDWGMTLSEDITMSMVLQVRDMGNFTSYSERSEILVAINNAIYKEKSNNPNKIVLNAIKCAQENEDIEIVLNGLDWESLRWDNGENVLHIIAKYAPYFSKNYVLTEKNIKLMNITDNDGRYPIEYFLCFCCSNINRVDWGEMLPLIEKHKLKKPDWLEVKMMIVENLAFYSKVDNAPLSIWKQETPEDFKKCLRTERGRKFIKMAGNCFTSCCDCSVYKTLSYGLDINKYLSINEDGYGFFEAAKGRNEVKLALIQSLCNISSYKYLGEKGDDFNNIKNAVRLLINKAFSIDIDVIRLEDELSKSNAISIFPEDLKELISSHFGSLLDMKITFERNKLLKAITPENVGAINPRNIENTSVL